MRQDDLSFELATAEVLHARACESVRTIAPLLLRTDRLGLMEVADIATPVGDQGRPSDLPTSDLGVGARRITTT